ncbi:MAG: hypothetical protein DMF69_19875 [Acidobacteria bacterium]|nr:MAG: hypothetical protein DMF69_19875 [Acidobacteriota bacterium]
MKPSRAQYRLLHLIAASSLDFHSWPYPRFQVPSDGGLNAAFGFSEETAKSVIEREWVRLRKLNTSTLETLASYWLTDVGQGLEEEICLKWTRGGRGFLRTEHDHEYGPRRNWDKDATEILGGKLICLDCGRRVPCVSIRSEVHSANLFDDYYGPVCSAHMDVVLKRRGWPWVRRSAA